MDYKLRKGMCVRIIKDVREGGPATGRFGKFVGDEECEAWLLCTADGKPERGSYELPDGYIEWDPEKEDFPKVNCGVRAKTPRFFLDDTFIHGGQCYWEPVNPHIKKRIAESYQLFLRKLGIPEDQIPTLEQLQAMGPGV